MPQKPRRRETVQHQNGGAGTDIVQCDVGIAEADIAGTHFKPVTLISNSKHSRAVARQRLSGPPRFAAGGPSVA
jgi:hypothetical protein